jgi:hypothetical protein
MRCDGNEPCAPCVSTKSTCHYSAPASSSSAPSSTPHTEPNASTDSDQTLDDLDDRILAPENTEPSPVDFVSKHSLYNHTTLSGSLDFVTSYVTGLDAAQTISATLPQTEFSGQCQMTMYHNMACEVPDISIPSENILCQFRDIGAVGDDWQIPAVVCSSTLELFKN